jgi:hypothetical protein
MQNFEIVNVRVSRWAYNRIKSLNETAEITRVINNGFAPERRQTHYLNHMNSWVVRRSSFQLIKLNSMRINVFGVVVSDFDQKYLYYMFALRRN